MSMWTIKALDHVKIGKRRSYNPGHATCLPEQVYPYKSGTVFLFLPGRAWKRPPCALNGHLVFRLKQAVEEMLKYEREQITIILDVDDLDPDHGLYLEHHGIAQKLKTYLDKNVCTTAV